MESCRPSSLGQVTLLFSPARTWATMAWQVLPYRISPAGTRAGSLEAWEMWLAKSPSPLPFTV